MRISFPASLLVLLLLVNACGKSQEETGNDNNGTSENSVCVSDEAKDSIPTAPLPDPALPPGQARIVGEITEISSPDSIKFDIIKLYVREVLEYGASTQPIVINDTLTMQTKVKSSTRKIKKNEKIAVIIQQNLSPESSTIPAWSIIKLGN